MHTARAGSRLYSRILILAASRVGMTSSRISSKTICHLPLSSFSILRDQSWECCSKLYKVSKTCKRVQ